MNGDPGPPEELVRDLLPDVGKAIAELKSTARRQILDNLVSLLEQAYQKGIAGRKHSRTQQKWFTIFGYLAQVSTRIVRDLEYEQLRAEVDELKQQVLGNNVTRLRRTILTPRLERSASARSNKYYKHSDRPC